MQPRTRDECRGHRPPLPHTCRPVISSLRLKLIDGDAVWGDQRIFDFPTSGCRIGVIGHQWTSDSHFQGNSREA